MSTTETQSAPSSNFKPGLEGVTAGISAISEVDAERNRLIFRGYDVHDLVDGCQFEEVAYLMLFGHLPTVAELAAFRAELTAQREIPKAVQALYQAFPNTAHPMDTLKAAVALIATLDPNINVDTTDARRKEAISLLAKIPSLVVNGYRASRGLSWVTPDPTLGWSDYFFQLLTEKNAPPELAKVFNVTQILYAEHGFNASTFSALVTVSTLSDLYSGVVSAIGTLKGALHGGANEAAMEMLLEIGEPENAREWVRDALAKKKKIMGFGHREYKKGDERARIVKSFIPDLSAAAGVSKWEEISHIVEDEMLTAKGLYPNVDFPVATVYYLMEIPVPIYTPIFVMSRVTGWCAHIMEQLENNRIFRPHSDYNGPRNLIFVPIEGRE